MPKKVHSKKKPKKVISEEPREIVEAPHSFVIHRGLSCPYILDLTKDFRRIMEPFTAAQLKERKSNKLKDFVSLSGIFHVSHMCVFNKAETQLSFKVGRLPRGPSLTFKVHQFTLARDVIALTKKQYVDEEMFKSSPLVIMNNFSGEGKHLKMMVSTFQNMFPAINLATINLGTIRRCVLFSYNPNTKLVDMRHYSIALVPVGITQGVKKMVQGKIPNLSRCEEISDFLVQGGMASDSEFEDDQANEVVLAQDIKTKGNIKDHKSAIRLHELGPRMTFELVKIEEGFFNGEVLYHQHVIKTEEEVERIRKMREKKAKLKERRKKEQHQNTLKKAKNLKGEKDGSKQKQEIPEEPEVEPDDDAAYYKEEVGEDPDDELFKQADNNSRKRVRIPKHISGKRMKFDKQGKDAFKTNKGKFAEKAEKGKFGARTEKRKFGANTEKRKFGSRAEKGKFGAKTEKRKFGAKAEKGKFGAKAEKRMFKERRTRKRK